MAWSIFSQPGGKVLAEAWAVLALQTIGAPTTPANIQFVYDWELSEGGGGKFNPLNQGPVPGVDKLTSTGQQYGGGAADYVSWSAGLAGFQEYMNMPNYAPIAEALRANDAGKAKTLLIESPWAKSHYGNGAKFSGAALSTLSPTDLAAVAAAAGIPSNAVAEANNLVGGTEGAVTPTSITGVAGDYAAAAANAVSGGLVGELGNLLQVSNLERAGIFAGGLLLAMVGIVGLVSTSKTVQQAGKAAGEAAAVA